jgi:hypothetical protein
LPNKNRERLMSFLQVLARWSKVVSVAGLQVQQA